MPDLHAAWAVILLLVEREREGVAVERDLDGIPALRRERRGGARPVSRRAARGPGREGAEGERRGEKEEEEGGLVAHFVWRRRRKKRKRERRTTTGK